MIGNEYIEFSKKNIIEYLKIILEKYYDKEITLKLLDTYIKVRYYNYYEIKYKDPEKNINYYMKKTVEQIKEDVKSKITFYIFKYILYFDNVKECNDIKKLIEEIKDFRIKTLKLIDEDFSNKLINLVKENQKRKNKFLISFNSEQFKIIKKSTNHKKVIQVDLEYNIKFNKIYSSYSINKVYNTGIINEQKAFITYYQTSLEIIKNAIESIYNIEYIVSFPTSILEKKQKTQRLKNIIENEIIKTNIILKITYSDYLENKEIINNWIKEGFNFAIIIDEKYNYEEVERMWLEIFKYIIIEKEKRTYFDERKTIIK